MSSRAPLAAFLILVSAASSRADGGDRSHSVPLRLACELATERDFVAAAVEFRRAALEADEPAERAALLWTAAHAYLEAGNAETAESMLDAAEDADPALADRAQLLRATAAFSRRDWESAAFFSENVLRDAGTPEARRAATRWLAVARLRQGHVAEARQALATDGETHALALEAVDHYQRTPRRSPRIGGVLGLVPGLGYAYSGEYANALRSLILNALFLYGMADTADDEEWGAFTVITFFELTWYTGSIYGGIDAAHRFNRQREEDCVGRVLGNTRVSPELSALPLLTLRWEF